MREIPIDGRTLSVDIVHDVAFGEATVRLTNVAEEMIRSTRLEMDKQLSKARADIGQYGAIERQRSLVRSTASGEGASMEKRMVRAAMLVRINSFALGRSGIRLENARLLQDMLNKDVVPVVPERSKIDANKDTMPLSFIALGAMGEGRTIYDGEVRTATEAMRRAGLLPMVPYDKEGWAMVNGTAYLTAAGSLNLYVGLNMLKISQIALAMSLESLRGDRQAFDPRSAIGTDPGQRTISSNLRALLLSGAGVSQKKGAVRDVLTVLGGPQVLGTVRDSLLHQKEMLEVEMNSGADDPMWFDDLTAMSGGGRARRIHFALDQMCLAIHTIGNFSERRTAAMIDVMSEQASQAPDRLGPGPSVLRDMADEIVSRNKILTASSSVVPFTTYEGDPEDVAICERMSRVTDNTEQLLAIEIISAVRSLDGSNRENGKGVRLARSFVTSASELRSDISGKDDTIEWLCKKLRDRSFLSHVERQVPLV